MAYTGEAMGGGGGEYCTIGVDGVLKRGGFGGGGGAIK